MLPTGSSNKLQVELSADITFNNLPSGLKIEALVICISSFFNATYARPSAVGLGYITNEESNFNEESPTEIWS